ncbi:MAG TPA: 23S rRNA (uridine(2552)-2'-O)-methyltransferase RlmE [Pseudomonadales bacterium]
MKRSKSSGRWLQEHFDDHYVKQAQKDGYRSRACYKLLEIQEKDQLIKKGMNLVDLGAAPGSWSQVAAKLVGDQGRVFASDILAMDALAGVSFIQGDFRDETVLNALLTMAGGQNIDLVISDMAPNISGTKSVDQSRAMYLAELALDFAVQVLRPGGHLLIKVFQGEGIDEYRRLVSNRFQSVKTRKPKASRPRSREIYLLAQGYRA